MYDLQIKKAIAEIKKAKPKLILIQLPEGLKKYALNISRQIETETSSKTIVSGNPCWGACDIAESEARELNADLILHFGHSKFTNTKTKVIYIPVEYTGKIQLSKDNLNKLKSFKSITLLASIQYSTYLEPLHQQLKNSIIPKDPHILGCKTPKITSEAVLVIGDKFHALGVALNTDSDVFCLTIDNKLENLAQLKSKTLSNYYNMVQDFKKATNIGIILSTKPGQKNLTLAKKIKQTLEANQKNVILLSLNELTPSIMDNFYNLEAFVNTACPRLSYEDISRFNKPVILPKDI